MRRRSGRPQSATRIWCRLPPEPHRRHARRPCGRAGALGVHRPGSSTTNVRSTGASKAPRRRRQIPFAGGLGAAAPPRGSPGSRIPGSRSNVDQSALGLRHSVKVGRRILSRSVTAGSLGSEAAQHQAEVNGPARRRRFGRSCTGVRTPSFAGRCATTSARRRAPPQPCGRARGCRASRRCPPRAAGSGQGELFPVWRYHAAFTDSPFVLVQAEAQHRRHAVIEQVLAELIDGPWPTCPPAASTPTMPGLPASRSTPLDAGGRGRRSVLPWMSTRLPKPVPAARSEPVASSHQGRSRATEMIAMAPRRIEHAAAASDMTHSLAQAPPGIRAHSAPLQPAHPTACSSVEGTRRSSERPPSQQQRTRRAARRRVPQPPPSSSRPSNGEHRRDDSGPASHP